MSKHFLLVSDFDQTLSFNDSGQLLSESLGITGFSDKVAGLARLNLVQSGATTMARRALVCVAAWSGLT